MWHPAAFNHSQSEGTVSRSPSLLPSPFADFSAGDSQNGEEWNMCATFSRTAVRMGCPARKHFRKRKPVVRLIQKRRRGEIDEGAWKPTMMTSIYSHCRAWWRPPLLRQRALPAKGISQRICVCQCVGVCTHMYLHVFIKARDYTEHCSRQEGRKRGGGGRGGESCLAAGAVPSLITNQTTKGLLPYRINAYVFLWRAIITKPFYSAISNN